MPSFFCSQCYASDIAWEISAGRGTLYSWTIVWRPQHPTFIVPYAPAIVGLEEGPRVLSAIVDCEPEDLAENMPLEVVYYPISEAITLPYFRPRRT